MPVFITRRPEGVMPDMHGIMRQLQVERLARLNLRTHEVDTVARQGDDTLGIVVRQERLPVVLEVPRTVSIGAVVHVISGLVRRDTLVVPLPKVSGHIVGVGLLQGLGNRDLAEILLLHLYSGEHGIP